MLACAHICMHYAAHMLNSVSHAVIQARSQEARANWEAALASKDRAIAQLDEALASRQRAIEQLISSNTAPAYTDADIQERDAKVGENNAGLQMLYACLAIWC